MLRSQALKKPLTLRVAFALVSEWCQPKGTQTKVMV